MRDQVHHQLLLIVLSERVIILIHEYRLYVLLLLLRITEVLRVVSIEQHVETVEQPVYLGVKLGGYILLEGWEG